MRLRNLKKSAALCAGLAATSLVLAACAADGEGDTDGENASKEITIGVFNGWDEGIAASFLWGAILEDSGYQVQYEFGDPVAVFDGVATGEYDVAFDAWLPNTHSDYWEQYGEEIEDLGAWFTDAPLTFAVNQDAPITSLTELADNADVFDNRLVGIEPGAGLTRITSEQVIPTYGLEGMEYLTSSSAAMLSELEGAIDRGENVVVTLWRPHWAYAAFPIRDLDDPEGTLGEPEEIHSFGRSGFAEDLPEVAGWVGEFTLTTEQLLSIEEIMVVQNEASNEAEYEASIRQWMESNPDFVAGATSS